MPILALLNTKGGFALIGGILVALVAGYYNLKIAGINALHSREISQLQAEAETQKAAAAINGKRNEVCQSDMAVAVGKIQEQNSALGRLKAEGDLKAKKAVAAALAAMHTPKQIKDRAEEGPAGPTAMNLFMAQEFGEGRL